MGGRSSIAGLVGFLMVPIGILTGLAGATPLDESVARLDRLERQRSELLAEADSLGRLLESLPAERLGTAREILRQAERLGKESAEVDVEILLTREACRTLALRELEGLRAGAASTEGGAARELSVLGLLEERLADRIGDELVLLQPDSLDGYETLLDKQAYLQDLRDRVETLDRRLAQRAERVRRERAIREASAGFTDEARFIDEGGRVGSDETVRLRGAPPAGGGGEGAARLGPAGSEGSAAAGEEAYLTLGPEFQPSADAIRTLSLARARLAQDLTLVSTALESTSSMLRRFGVESP